MASSNNAIKKSYTIAVETLQKNYASFGILAGQDHFSDLWTRDACFAAWGALSINNYHQVKHTLLTIIKNTNDEGQVPLRFGAYTFLFKFLGFPTKNQARYIDDKNYSLPTDNNSLFLIALEKYTSQSKDASLITDYLETIESIINWNIHKTKNHLMVETKYAGWADSLKKTGWVLYTNILYIQSLKSYQLLSDHIDSPKSKEDEIQTALSRATEQLMERFWNGAYFIDFIDQESSEEFSTDGNLLAILFDIASPNQSKSILTYIMDHSMIKNGCIDSCHPKYKKSLIYTPFRFINLADYHNGLYWLWLKCLFIAALAKHPDVHPFDDYLSDLANVINSHQGIYEVYNASFKPLNRLFYKSERNFSWSSGLFIWMIHQLPTFKNLDIESSI